MSKYKSKNEGQKTKNNIRPHPGCHELPSAHLTDLTGFVSRGGSSPPRCAGAGWVCASPASSAALSSSSSSSSPTPNNSSRSSQTLPSAKLADRARPLPFFVLFCGNIAEAGVSGLLCSGSNCVPPISSSVSESRLREELDPESGRYNLEICRVWWFEEVDLYIGRGNVPRVFDDSTARDDRQRRGQFRIPEDWPSRSVVVNMT
jgi:hypothetical protein